MSRFSHSSHYKLELKFPFFQKNKNNSTKSTNENRKEKVLHQYIEPFHLRYGKSNTRKLLKLYTIHVFSST